MARDRTGIDSPSLLIDFWRWHLARTNRSFIWFCQTGQALDSSLMMWKRQKAEITLAVDLDEEYGFNPSFPRSFRKTVSTASWLMLDSIRDRVSSWTSLI